MYKLQKLSIKYIFSCFGFLLAKVVMLIASLDNQILISKKKTIIQIGCETIAGFWFFDM